MTEQSDIPKKLLPYIGLEINNILQDIYQYKKELIHKFKEENIPTWIICKIHKDIIRKLYEVTNHAEKEINLDIYNVVNEIWD